MEYDFFIFSGGPLQISRIKVLILRKLIFAAWFSLVYLPLYFFFFFTQQGFQEVIVKHFWILDFFEKSVEDHKSSHEKGALNFAYYPTFICGF